MDDRPFIKCGDDWVSWREFDEVSDSAAAAFQGIGVEKGSHVAHLADTSMQLIEAFFGLVKAGALLVPVNVYLKGEFLRYTLAHSRASVVVVDELGLAGITPLLGELPELREVVVLGDSFAGLGAEGFPPGIHVRSYRELTARAVSFQPPDIEPGDPYAVIYTSGTTGRSKGCVQSNRFALRNGEAVKYIFGLTPSDRTICPWPLYHQTGHTALVTALAAGVSVVMEPRLVVDEFIARVAAEDVTYFISLGTLGPGLLKTPPGPLDRAHKVHSCLIVPTTPEVQDALRQRFGFEVSAELYGQTECSPLTANRVRGYRSRKTAGRPMPDLEMALLGEDNLPVPVGEIGEISVRPLDPGAVFDGYLDDPEATVAASKSLWFHTGDLGRLDEEGNLTFVDRKKDMLRRHGENISSFELEAAVRAHPDVRDAVVHETQDAREATNEILAWVVPQPGAEIEVESFAEFLWQTVPYFAVPRYIRIVDDLPVTPTGKIEKYKLRARPFDVDKTIDLKERGLLTPRHHRRVGPQAEQAQSGQHGNAPRGHVPSRPS
jgi:crotonobetaine/carnitine-CoA ligase